MTLSRVLGAIGRTLITSGCMVLLFVAFQLWGTGIQAGAAQNDLADELNERFAAAPTAVPVVETAPVVVEDASGEQVLVEPTPTPVSKEFLEQLYPEAGDPLARIVIDKIEVDQVIVSGVGVEDLKKGPGHYGSTVLPGNAGNAGIAGHRTTYGAPFHRVDELVPGDEIKVQTLQGLFTYRVIDHGDGLGHTIVNPDGTHVLDDFGDNRLTLTACHPKYSARQRIIVFAELVGEPAETLPHPDDWEPPDLTLAAEDVSGTEAQGADTGQTVNQIVTDDPATTDDPTLGVDVAGDPVLASELDDDGINRADAGSSAGGLGSLEGGADDFGEGLSGDRDAIVPAALWAAAAAAMWMTGRFIGARTRRLPVYLLGLLPFAGVLWVSFFYMDRALPSY